MWDNFFNKLCDRKLGQGTVCGFDYSWTIKQEETSNNEENIMNPKMPDFVFADIVIFHRQQCGNPVFK